MVYPYQTTTAYRYLHAIYIRFVLMQVDRSGGRPGAGQAAAAAERSADRCSALAPEPALRCVRRVRGGRACLICGPHAANGPYPICRSQTGYGGPFAHNCGFLRHVACFMFAGGKRDSIAFMRDDMGIWTRHVSLLRACCCRHPLGTQATAFLELASVESSFRHAASPSVSVAPQRTHVSAACDSDHAPGASFIICWSILQVDTRGI